MWCPGAPSSLWVPTPCCIAGVVVLMLTASFGLGRGAMAHGGRQRGGWTHQCSRTDPGTVQPARDGRVRHSYPYHPPLKQDLSQLQRTNPTPFDLCRRTAREDCLITPREAAVSLRGRTTRCRRGTLAALNRDQLQTLPMDDHTTSVVGFEGAILAAWRRQRCVRAGVRRRRRRALRSSRKACNRLNAVQPQNRPPKRRSASSDSLPEGTGFEPSVPRKRRPWRETPRPTIVVSRDDLLNGPIQLIGPASPSATAERPVRKSGTDGSNPVPSSTDAGDRY